MGARASKELHAAVHRLKATPEFQTFMDKVKSDLSEADKVGRVLEGTELYRNQGKAQYLESIVKLVSNTGDVLRKINEQTP